MIPVEFDYEAPSSLSEALKTLSECPDEAKALAGGHSLVPLMKLRLAMPTLLVDLRHIDELRGISLDGDRLNVGAMTTHAELASSPVVQQHAPALAQAASEIGDRQVRARGTIGGALAHCDPAADLPAVVLALDAELRIASSRGERSVAAGSFFKGLLETDLAPDELLVSLSFQAAPRSAYVKFPNAASHYALTGVAVALQGDGTMQSARIGVTGAAVTAFRASGAEAALGGKALSNEAIEAASEASVDGRELLSDIHASAEYRASLIKVATKRALQKLMT